MARRGSGTRARNGQGTVWRLPDGRYRARVMIEGQLLEAYGPSSDDALDRLARKRLGLWRPTEHTTVAEYLDHWLPTVQPRLAPQTYRTYEGYIRNHITPGLGSIRLDRLGYDQVETFLRRCARQLAPRTIHHLRAILRAALNKALRQEVVVRNAATLLDLPRIPDDEVEPLDMPQTLRFLDGIRGDRWEALYLLAIGSGLRQGEILGLQWADLEPLDDRTLHLRHKLERVDHHYQLSEPKRRSRRLLDLPESTIEALRVRKRAQNQGRLLLGPAWERSHLVFTTETGRPLNGQVVTHRFQRQLAGLGLPRRTFHQLRHTYTSLLLANGVSLDEVSKALGHRGIEITSRIYAHLYPVRRREIADTMDTILRGTS